jgi:IS5 family transposase
MKMKQQTFSDIEYSGRKRKTKREEFLEIMDEIIPWEEWVALIAPHYYEGKRGRPPKGIEKMLRMYLLQSWFNLSDEGVEDSIYDSYAMRKFIGLNFIKEQVPDATTLLHFRRIVEENHIGELLFNTIREGLERSGHIMHGGTIVDATIIDAPSSTKNAEKARDPEMCQAMKGNEWRFGMKLHTGVDAGTGYVVSAETTPANVHDITVAAKLIREDDEVVYGDAGYLGIEKRPEILGDEHLSRITYRINRRPGKLRSIKNFVGIQWEKVIERQKSSVRCKVEHPYRFIKVQFGYRKVRYRGLAKNKNRLFVLLTSSNLYMFAKAGNHCAPVMG